MAVVIFLLFWLIGFSQPFSDDPNFNAPLFTDVLLVFMGILIVAALVLAVWALWREINMARQNKIELDNNIPVGKIRRYVVLGTIISVVLTGLFASRESVSVNGNQYNDWLGLTASDLFVNTSIIMIVAAIGTVFYGATKYRRKR
jgi:quinol-cytochrome oxidoreductase complex cytochrome b subunit